MLQNLSYGMNWFGGFAIVVLFWTGIFLLVHCLVYQLTGVQLYKKIAFGLFEDEWTEE